MVTSTNCSPNPHDHILAWLLSVDCAQIPRNTWKSSGKPQTTPHITSLAMVQVWGLGVCQIKAWPGLASLTPPITTCQAKLVYIHLLLLTIPTLVSAHHTNTYYFSPYQYSLPLTIPILITAHHTNTYYHSPYQYLLLFTIPTLVSAHHTNTNYCSPYQYSLLLNIPILISAQHTNTHYCSPYQYFLLLSKSILASNGCIITGKYWCC